MSKYFDSVSKALINEGYKITDNGTGYTITKTYKQKYIIPKHMYSKETIKEKLNAKNVEILGDKFVGYEYCVVLDAEVEKKKVINFDRRVSNENERISSVIESMIAELHNSNSKPAKTLLHTLFDIKNEYDPRTTGIIFGHIE